MLTCLQILNQLEPVEQAHAELIEGTNNQPIAKD
jgi:hypothetical protein